MGLYDTVTVINYPLPDNIKRKSYQTKDFSFPYLEEYEIRADGTLWHELYDIEDHSDPNAEGIMALSGIFTRVNKRWEKINYTGVLNFYDYDKEDGWVEFNAHFWNGRVHRIERIK